LPDAGLIQRHRLAAAIGLDQSHVMDIEAPVGDLISAGLTDAYVAVGFAAGEILAIDLGLELHRGAAFRVYGSAAIVIIAAAASH